ncbi:unnamed protein product [Bursaphelenchus xylophilus]|uniref:(pine wood nematode) hypothetical protein n=1 Tax=Bursaphelenchus xylophilus TaxID=6326 RepID=A0A1I7RJP7_BURXY|nr:unnamed protein product [Bursaphelenchus xylophilus]CAG9128979.1 unnamed protein product [Bursaphelenchus xylophilus]
MLFMCAITDFTFWMMDMLVQIKGKEANGIVLIKLEGPVGYLDRKSQLLGTTAYVVSACLSMTVLPAQTYFRYHSITRSISINGVKTSVLFFISVLFCFPLACLCYTSYNISAEASPGFNYGTLWYREVPLPTLLIGNTASMYQKLYFAMCALLFILSYTGVVVLGFCTARALKRREGLYTVRTRRLQKQMSLFLVCQAVSLLCISVVPGILVIVPSFFHLDSGMTLGVGLLSLSWIPACNAVTTICDPDQHLDKQPRVQTHLEPVNTLGASGTSRTTRTDTRKWSHHGNTHWHSAATTIGSTKKEELIYWTTDRWRYRTGGRRLETARRRTEEGRARA